MTSSDERLFPKIKVQMEAISRNLSSRDVNFFLFHEGKSCDALDSLHRFAAKYSNLHFFDIVINQPDQYNKLSVMGGGQKWGGAAYYSLCAYQYLPPEVDRILYLDAGDTLVVDNIDEYYFSDFQGCSLLAMSQCFKIVNDEPILFDKDDLFNQLYTSSILRGVFNSGSYVINLEKCRAVGLTIEECLQYAEALCALVDKKENVYWGDQGFLSALFVGDIQFYKYPEIRHWLYMPYNFCMWYFDYMVQKVDYKPHILHWAGALKPWQCMYPIFLQQFQKQEDLHNMSELKLGQAEYYYLWHEYAILAAERK